MVKGSISPKPAMTTLQERDIRNYIQELQEEGHSDAAAWLATLLTSHQRNQADTDG
tara:strand:- start:1354 stop:1521 length:168 start_codon:yes stop_codon:yes gene_type:complete